MSHKQILTVGHSNTSFKDFLDKLQKHGVTHLVDVRIMPRSRFVPWSNQKTLQKTLEQQAIAYTHLPALGGMRHTHRNSINLGWHNKSFRGFADYMQTHDFFSGLKILLQLIKTNKQLIIMCAESLPWRCHRSLIADALIIRKFKVLHIISLTVAQPHILTSFAKVDKKKRPIQIYYPAEEEQQLKF